VSVAQVRSDRVRAVEASRRTVVGLALSSNDDCSYHSALVLKYGMLMLACRVLSIWAQVAVDLSIGE
jgi:hypothetical protein